MVRAAARPDFMHGTDKPDAPGLPFPPGDAPLAMRRPSAVAGSTVSAYAEMCSGPSSTVSSSVRSHDASVSPSAP